MSQERRERKKEKQGIRRRNWGRITIYALLIVAAFGLAYYLGNRTRHKHDAFARCLTERGVKMYGAWWCPHCVEQKEKFDASFEYVSYMECGVKGNVRAIAPGCRDENIKEFPTWQFPPMGERVARVFTLQELSDRTGCSLP